MPGKIILTALLTLGLAANVFAADKAMDQVSTAAMHAKFSAKSKDIAGVHLHLHHVLNCLVGKDGDGFDASAGNPCQGKGNGAVNDASDDLKFKLSTIAAQVRKGLADDNLDSAQATASDVHSMLEGIDGSDMGKGAMGKKEEM